MKQAAATTGTNTDSYEIQALRHAIQKGNKSACRLLVQYGTDPFLQDGGEDTNENEEHDRLSTPFQYAARLEDIADICLERRQEYLSSVGEYPIHVPCRYPQVSLHAVKLLLDHPSRLGET